MSPVRARGQSTQPLRPRDRSLADIRRFRRLVEQWHPGNYWGPEAFSPFSRRPVWWICRRQEGFKHVFFAPIDARTRSIVQGHKSWGCPFCSGSKGPPRLGAKRLPEELAREWMTRLNGMPARYLHTLSTRLGLWQCRFCGHQWRTKVLSRVTGVRQGCPACYKHKGIDLTKYICTRTIRRTGSGRERVKKIELKVSELFEKGARNSGYNIRKLPPTHKVFWVCPINAKHRFYQSFEQLKANDFDCPRCFSYLAEYEELVEDYDPELNDGLTADRLSIEKNSKRMITWSCDAAADHIWQARLYDRLHRGYGCPYCSGRRLCWTNSLAKSSPAAALEFDYEKNKKITPDQIAAASSQKVWWLCRRCGHSWQTQVRLRTRRGQGCPKCKRVGKRRAAD